MDETCWELVGVGDPGTKGLGPGLFNSDNDNISGQTPASQLASPPDSVTPPSLSSRPTGDTWGYCQMSVTLCCQGPL